MRAGVGKVDLAQDLEKDENGKSTPGFFVGEVGLGGTCRDDSLGELCLKTLKAVEPVWGRIHTCYRAKE